MADEEGKNGVGLFWGFKPEVFGSRDSLFLREAIRGDEVRHSEGVFFGGRRVWVLKKGKPSGDWAS